MLTDPAPRENVFVRYGARALYAITGIMCCILGIVGAIGFSVSCVFAGIFLFFIGLFILITEMPFCCAFIPQTEYITRIVTKIGPLPIAIVLALLGIIAMAMCPSVSMGFALCFLLGSAALRIREFILLSVEGPNPIWSTLRITLLHPPRRTSLRRWWTKLERFSRSSSFALRFWVHEPIARLIRGVYGQVSKGLLEEMTSIFDK